MKMRRFLGYKRTRNPPILPHPILPPTSPHPVLLSSFCATRHLILIIVRLLAASVSIALSSSRRSQLHANAKMGNNGKDKDDNERRPRRTSTRRYQTAAPTPRPAQPPPTRRQTLPVRHAPATVVQRRRVPAPEASAEAVPAETAATIDTPAFLAALQRFTRATLCKDLGDLDAEFKQLYALPKPQASPEFVRNMQSNRYRDVICAEQNRVILANGRYVHANWIEYLGDRRFICTQGPLPTTCDEFWTMVVQEEIDAIVMLCDCVELNRPKCHQYWPTARNPVMKFANETIVVNYQKDMHVDGDLYKTYCAVTTTTPKPMQLQVRHFHWRQWPDRGVPINHLAVLRLLYYIAPYRRVIVHCSAGIGRTGTVVAIYLAQLRLRAGMDLDVFELVRDLRQQRAQSVQSIDQYLYVYNVILRYARNKAEKNALQMDLVAADKLLEAIANRIKKC